jgi:hypothetical protein
MTAIARKGDKVLSPSGKGNRCRDPMETAVGEVNTQSVFSNSKLIPVNGNKVEPHNRRGCVPDESRLDSFSPNVFIGNKQVGRIGDQYATGTDEANKIAEGSPNVFANG